MQTLVTLVYKYVIDMEKEVVCLCAVPLFSDSQTARNRSKCMYHVACNAA